MKTRVHIRRRLHRRYSTGIDRYGIEARLAPMYDGVRTVPELRERFRQLVETDAIWDAIAGIQQSSKSQDDSLHALECAVKDAFLPRAPKRRKKAA